MRQEVLQVLHSDQRSCCVALCGFPLLYCSRSVLRVLFQLFFLYVFFYRHVTIFFFGSKFAEVKSKGTSGKMSNRNGMSGLSSRETAPKGFNHIPNGLGSYVDPMPNEKKQQTPPNKKQKSPKLCMPDSKMRELMSIFFGNSLNKGNEKDSWKWFRFCEEILGLELTTAENYWKGSLKHHYDSIKKSADYNPMVWEARDGKTYVLPTMTKSGMHFMLSQEVEGLWPKGRGTRNQHVASLLLEFIAEDARNVANGGAKAISSAPMRQSCSPVQAQNPSPMQVLAVCVHRVLLHHLS
jgi:hypothetical protein